MQQLHPYLKDCGRSNSTATTNVACSDYHFSARFALKLVMVVAAATCGIQDEDGLQGGLGEGEDG